MTLAISLRRRIALWICPELALKAPVPFDPADLPVFQGKVVPHWWSNTELRTFLTASHRRMKLVQALEIAVERFGEEAPSKSALQRYWAMLDVQHSPATPEIPSQEAS